MTHFVTPRYSGKQTLFLNFVKYKAKKKKNVFLFLPFMCILYNFIFRRVVSVRFGNKLYIAFCDIF